ncbi:MAG: hypothetical protein VX966_02615 [Chloroflexota bacterium]|nr:hypothetical protein [Chloroflexota bacterium]
MVTVIERQSVSATENIREQVQLQIGPDSIVEGFRLHDNWHKVSKMINLWEMSGVVSMGKPVLEMKFQATLDDGTDVLLSHDVLAENWYVIKG